MNIIFDKDGNFEPWPLSRYKGLLGAIRCPITWELAAFYNIAEDNYVCVACGTKHTRDQMASPAEQPVLTKDRSDGGQEPEAA